MTLLIRMGVGRRNIHGGRWKRFRSSKSTRPGIDQRVATSHVLRTLAIDVVDHQAAAAFHGDSNQPFVENAMHLHDWMDADGGCQTTNDSPVWLELITLLWSYAFSPLVLHSTYYRYDCKRFPLTPSSCSRSWKRRGSVLCLWTESNRE